MISDVLGFIKIRRWNRFTQVIFIKWIYLAPEVLVLSVLIISFQNRFKIIFWQFTFIPMFCFNTFIINKDSGTYFLKSLSFLFSSVWCGIFLLFFFFLVNKLQSTNYAQTTYHFNWVHFFVSIRTSPTQKLYGLLKYRVYTLTLNKKIKFVENNFFSHLV